MNRTATRWTGGRSAGVGILILGLAFAMLLKRRALIIITGRSASA
jgi:hypothetical protein